MALTIKCTLSCDHNDLRWDQEHTVRKSFLDSGGLAENIHYASTDPLSTLILTLDHADTLITFAHGVPTGCRDPIVPSPPCHVPDGNCVVDTTVLDPWAYFPSPADQDTIKIINIGPGQLTATVTLGTCVDHGFTLSGDLVYDLAVGDTAFVLVDWEPPADLANVACTIDTGAPCPSVSVTATPVFTGGALWIDGEMNKGIEVLYKREDPGGGTDPTAWCSREGRPGWADPPYYSLEHNKNIHWSILSCFADAVPPWPQGISVAQTARNNLPAEATV